MKELLNKRAKLKLLINSLYGSHNGNRFNITTLNIEYNKITNKIIKYKKRIVKLKRILNG